MSSLRRPITGVCAPVVQPPRETGANSLSQELYEDDDVIRNGSRESARTGQYVAFNGPRRGVSGTRGRYNNV